MRMRLGRIGVISGLFILSGFVSSCAVADEVSAKQAEATGNLRQALTQYTAALQSVPENSEQEQQLREKIIALAQKITPAPTVSSEVIDYEGRAEAAVGMAKTPSDFLDAAKEYKKALLAAPWLAKDYFNLAVVLEKAEKQKEAIRNYNFYLLAAPNAPEKIEVQKKIAGLKYQMEKLNSARTAEKKQAGDDENLAQQLVGVWHNPVGSFMRGYHMRIEADGTKVRWYVIGTPDSNGTYTPVNYLWIEGEIKGGRLVGTFNQFGYNSRGLTSMGSQPYDSKITVSDDGQMFKGGDFEGWDQDNHWGDISIKE